MQSIQFAPVSREYSKNKTLKHEDVACLMEWVKTQPHLPEVTELEVITFLHACLFNMDDTKKIIDCYFTFRTECTEFFQNRSPDEHLQAEMEVAVISFLPGLTHEGCAVMFAKLLDADPKKFHWSELVKILGMIIDLYILKNGTCTGIVAILDMEGGTFQHLKKISPMMLKKTVVYFRDAVNARRRAIFLLHPAPFVETLLTLVRPFLDKELYDMIHICKGNVDDIFTVIPRKMVPKYLGGNGLDVSELHGMMKRKLIENEAFFAEDELKRRVDETLRPAGRRWYHFWK